MLVAFAYHSRNAFHARGLTRFTLDKDAIPAGALLLRRRRIIVDTVTIIPSSGVDAVSVLRSLGDIMAGCLRVLHLFASARDGKRVRGG